MGTKGVIISFINCVPTCILTFIWSAARFTKGIALRMDSRWILNGLSHFIMAEYLIGLTGGPIVGEFKLAQFHFHWGCDNNCGSEHTLEGRCFPAEVRSWSLNWSQLVNKRINLTQGIALCYKSLFCYIKYYSYSKCYSATVHGSKDVLD